MASKSKRVFGLDVLRALAILLVCLLHGRELIVEQFPNFPQLWIVDGVELFFSLSGFLVGGIFIKLFYKKDRFKFKDLYNFWIRRWFRTLPNYYFILFLNIGLLWYWSKGQIVSNIWKYFFFLQNFTYLDSYRFFGESWSLTIEEWFYLSFPLVCVLFSIFIKGKLKKPILIGTIAIIVISIIMRNVMMPRDGETMGIFDWVWQFRNVTVYRLDAIMYGVIGAYISIFYNELWLKYRNILFVIGIIGIYLMTYQYPYTSNFRMVNSDILSSLSILALLPMLSNWKQCKYKWISEPITIISKISYSMYLINATLLMGFLNRYFPVIDRPSAVKVYILFWVLTLGLSYLNFTYFEKPTTKLREKFAIS